MSLDVMRCRIILNDLFHFSAYPFFIRFVGIIKR